jgi:hypothetical protein
MKKKETVIVNSETRSGRIRDLWMRYPNERDQLTKMNKQINNFDQVVTITLTSGE